MLRLPPLTYLMPRSLSQAVDWLAEHGASAMLVAGGTDLYPSMKRQLVKPSYLIGLRGLSELQQIVVREGELDYPASDSTGVTLGAGVTLNQIARHPGLMQQYPVLAQAVNLISTPQLRNMGTLGGNLCLDTRCTYYNQSAEWRQALGYCMKKAGQTCWVAPGGQRCWAVQSSDLAPVLMALDAQVELVGPQGTRGLPLAAFYQNDGLRCVTKQPDEILSAVHLPPTQQMRASYQKLRRRGSFDFPVLSVAIAIEQDIAGICTRARVVLGAVASAPMRVPKAEACLIGRPLGDPGIMSEVAEAVFDQAKPLDNTDLPLSYRKQMARVYTLRALRDINGTKIGEPV